MRAEWVAWERAGEVRRAARGWREAGAIDGETLERIESLYRDPRILPGIVWRALGFFFGSLAMLGVLGAGVTMHSAYGSGLGFLCVFVGVAGLVAAELQERSPVRCDRGGAGAASFWGTLFVIAGIWILLGVARVRGDELARISLAVSAVLWTAACRRWGPWIYAALAAFSGFVFLSTFPIARPLWLVAGVLVAAASHRNLDRSALAPSHRESAAARLVTALLAMYAAINTYSLDTSLIESFVRGWNAGPAPEALRSLSAIGTALFPAALIVWGLRSRRTLLLDSGVIALALSLMTLRHYVHLAPLWAVLAGSGALLVGATLALDRALSRAPAKERFGFTVEPLSSGERRARVLEVVPVVAGLAPGASAATREEGGFAGGGGRFGGGGATGSV